MSIHQPRYSIYKEFDTLTLLSLGDLVYHGPTQPVLQHFAEIGIMHSLCRDGPETKWPRPYNAIINVYVHVTQLSLVN